MNILLERLVEVQAFCNEYYVRGQLREGTFSVFFPLYFLFS